MKQLDKNITIKRLDTLNVKQGKVSLIFRLTMIYKSKEDRDNGGGARPEPLIITQPASNEFLEMVYNFNKEHEMFRDAVDVLENAEEVVEEEVVEVITE